MKHKECQCGIESQTYESVKQIERCTKFFAFSSTLFFSAGTRYLTHPVIPIPTPHLSHTLNLPKFQFLNADDTDVELLINWAS
jgi:hypothetical protein